MGDLVDLATQVGLHRFAEELRQHGLAANGGMLLGAPMGSEQYIRQWCDKKIVVLLHKIAAVMELPREFAVKKFTAIVQGLRPKWTHAVARFYIAAPLVKQSFCNTVQEMCVRGSTALSRTQSAPHREREGRVASGVVVVVVVLVVLGGYVS